MSPSFRLWNGLVLGLCFAASIGGSSWRNSRGDRPRPAETPTSVVDATGQRFEARPRDRIVSLSTRADQVLVDLVPESLAAITKYSAQGLDAHRYRGIPTIPRMDDVEAIVAFDPDLVVVNAFMDPRRVARLREAGFQVFDLGPLEGLDSFLEDVTLLGQVLGRPEPFRAWAATFHQRMHAVAADIPPRARPPAMYVSVYGDKLYGGARGTSYHDVIVHGGMKDAASPRFSGWPELTPEHLIELDPEYLVTQPGMTEAICGRPGLSRLKPCLDSTRAIEVPAELLGDPGRHMLDAAEWIRRQVHGLAPAPE